jgi:outer membrane protein assembly factor BamB
LTVAPDLSGIQRKLPSVSAFGTIGAGRILTQTSAGSAFYDAQSGKATGHPALVRSNWFAGAALAYTVASVQRKNATLYAYDRSGRQMWNRTVGPPLNAQDWPHAVTPKGLYVQMLKPQGGVEALDPVSGRMLWKRTIPNIQRMVVANDILYVLTYGLGQQVRVVGLRAQTGVPIGAVVLSAGYYAFPASNGLIVANGMVYIRAVGPLGTLLVALGL